MKKYRETQVDYGENKDFVEAELERRRALAEEERLRKLSETEEETSSRYTNDEIRTQEELAEDEVALIDSNVNNELKAKNQIEDELNVNDGISQVNIDSEEGFEDTIESEYNDEISDEE